jgi:hypothetical protein
VLAALAGLALALPLPAHDPITTKLTWTREISRLVQEHCAACHRPGGRAMSLLTYEDARPWAKAIRDEVLNRRMPPWDAVKGVGEFRGDLSLAQPELDLIVNWVEGGAPEGDPAYLPAPRRFADTAPDPAPRGPAREFRQPATLQAPLVVKAIRPLGAVEIAAVLPDGRVLRLLWVRRFREEWNRAYMLRQPARLPKGTRIVVTGAGAVFY